MGTLEVLVYTFDFSPYLLFGEVPVSPQSQMVDVTNGGNTVVTLPDAPTLSGNVLSQVVRGSSLAAAHNYRLTVLVGIQGSVKEWSMDLDVMVPH